MIARLLVAFGSSFAAVGLTLLGMATSYLKHDGDMRNIGLYLIAGGLVATVVGIVWYRADERRAEEAIAARAVRVNQPTRR